MCETAPHRVPDAAVVEITGVVLARIVLRAGEVEDPTIAEQGGVDGQHLRSVVRVVQYFPSAHASSLEDGTGPGHRPCSTHYDARAGSRGRLYIEKRSAPRPVGRRAGLSHMVIFAYVRCEPCGTRPTVRGS
jgi:hypothetical protein